MWNLCWFRTDCPSSAGAWQHKRTPRHMHRHVDTHAHTFLCCSQVSTFRTFNQDHAHFQVGLCTRCKQTEGSHFAERHTGAALKSLFPLPNPRGFATPWPHPVARGGSVLSGLVGSEVRGQGSELLGRFSNCSQTFAPRLKTSFKLNFTQIK